MSDELTQTYEPNPALRALYRTFFDSIHVDPAWAGSVRDLASRGTVVYLLRNLNFVDFFALDHLTKRYGLPQIRFVNDLGLGVLSPMGKGWLNAVRPRRGVTPADELRDALVQGGSAALFLKRPPTVLDVVAGASGGRGLKEGDPLVQTLVDLQREWPKPIWLVPQVFVWTKHADTRGKNWLDGVLGPREWPGPLRTAGQFLYNYKHAALRAGEAFDLREYLATSEVTDDETRVRRITYAVLARLERERRAVVGPAGKPPDRVRDEIVRSPKLRAVIEDLAGEGSAERAAVTARALDMLRELMATPDMSTVQGLELLFDRVFNRIYAGIEYRGEQIEALRSAAKSGTVVLLPSHKSHIDYLVLSYVFMKENLQLPLIAAGDNLNFFPAGPVLRRGGAFFIRRSFKGDRLYAAVVDTYVRRLIRTGYPIELFLEGGRSRTGKLLPPKFGLLSMLVDAALGVSQRRVYFVPISIGYERVVEAQSYGRELGGGEKSKEDAKGLLRTTRVLRSRYGRITLELGEISSLDQLRAELGLADEGELSPAQRRALVTRLGNRTMDEINRVTAVTPGALTALALLSHPRRGVAHEELVERARRFLVVLHEGRARITPSLATGTGSLRAEAIREALQMFADGGLVEVHAPIEAEPAGRGALPAGPDALYTIPDTERLQLDTTKNIIVHFFVERALVSIALLVAPGPPVASATARDRVHKLSRLFKHEFRFRADKRFDLIFDETQEAMLRAGELVIGEGQTLAPGPGRLGWSGREWLVSYAGLLRNFLEGYRVAARGLAALLKGPLAEKDLVRRALGAGQRMYLAGEIERRESISKPLVQNALLAFVDQGYVVRSDDGKLALAGSFDNARAVATIEGRVTGYLERRGV